MNNASFNMSAQPVYIASCTKGDIEHFMTWLESLGFCKRNYFVYFKGWDALFVRGQFGVRINEEYEMWSFSVGNEPEKLVGGPWYAVQDIAMYLGRPISDRIDPAMMMKFLRDNLPDVEKLLYTKPFDAVAARLRMLAIERKDRLSAERRSRRRNIS